jgi:hypothetical protein
VAISSRVSFFRGNAPFGGGEKPESGPNYLSSLIHVELQTACSMVTCSGLASIVQEMIAQNPVFISRLEFNWGRPWIHISRRRAFFEADSSVG